ncbi:MAG: FAD-dependent oxidoreductase, partial [Thermoanaerobaculia bacterium]
MSHVTVLGAGLVGAFVARTLAEDGFDVTAVDRSEAALGALAGVPRLATRRADLSSPDALAQA